MSKKRKVACWTPDGMVPAVGIGIRTATDST